MLFNLTTRRYPVTFIHFVTNRCNARCAHCFIDFDNKEFFKNELSLEEIQKFSKSLKGLFNINLTGGEPFLRTDMKQIVKAYYASVNSIYITTNGYFTDRILDLATHVKENFPKKKLFFSISLDDFDDRHDANRKIKGLSKRAYSSYSKIEGLNSKNINANINITVTPMNYKRIEEIYRHLTKEKGIKAITSTIIRLKKLTPEQRRGILKAYRRLNTLINESTRGFIGSFLSRILNAKNRVMRRKVAEAFEKQEYISPCYAAKLMGVMYANGDVYPCEVLQTKIGNVRDYNYNLKKLWAGKKAKQIRALIKQKKCNCTFECAWSINILGNPRYYPKILAEMLK